MNAHLWQHEVCLKIPVGIHLERTRFELQLDGRLHGDVLQILLYLNLMFFYHLLCKLNKDVLFYNGAYRQLVSLTLRESNKII